MSKPVAPDEFVRHTLIDAFSKGRFQEVEAMCQQLVVDYPKHSLAFKMQGVIHVKNAKYDLAVKSLQKAIALAPKDWEAFNSLGLAFKGLRKNTNAESAYRQCIQIKGDYAPVYANLGALLRETGKLQEALKCYTKKLELDSQDDETRHHVAALSGTQTTSAPQAYVRTVFDSYAGHFDSHLVSQLNYRIPSKLAQTYQRHALGAPLGKVLDLGCGTGLVAEACEGLQGQWHGVDLSPAMLAKAEAKSLYTKLSCGDLLDTMAGLAPASCDNIFAADVFIYVGDIQNVVKEAARILAPKGLFIFSVEALPEGGDPTGTGYRLLESGRYAHSQSHIETLAQKNGLDIVSIEPTDIRQDNNQPVHGLIVTLGRPG